VTWGIHAFMQNTNNGNSVVRDAKVDQMPLNALATIAWPNVITSRRRLGRLRQLIKCNGEGIDVTVSLVQTPVLDGVRPDSLKIALRSGCEAIFSHGQ
jgi:hypothetical protein